MATANHSTTDNSDGPRGALAALYEANDFLNVLLAYNEETSAIAGGEVSGRLAAQTTLAGEISLRLNRAVEHLDRAVDNVRPIAPASPAADDVDGEESTAPRSLLIEPGNPAATLDNCRRIVQLLQLVDRKDGTSESAEMGELLLLYDLDAALVSLEGAVRCKGRAS
jgi:hypothetical protein